MMDTTAQKLVESIERRLKKEISVRNPVKFLLKMSYEDIIDQAVSTIYLYTRSGKGRNKQVFMIELISAIGHGLRSRYKLTKDSALAAKAGAFILYSFESLGILKVILGRGTGKHNTYVVEVLKDSAIVKLWEGIPKNKIEKLPSEKPYAPWASYRHETGAILVKTQSFEVLESLTPATHPIVFDCVNRSQEIGWQINEFIYELHSWALENETDAFREIWEMQNPVAKQSKIREAHAIGGIAKRFIGKTFWHMYYFDFRGRRYPATAYLHEQGSDLARGLLLRADSKLIGEQGFFWLCISIASSWAGDAGRSDGYKTDKIPINDRVLWVLDNEDIILSYAKYPKVNQGWMQADKPWQFIAACNELLKFRNWQDVQMMWYNVGTSEELPDEYGYESSLEVFVDGSNNGSQHLSALTRDDITAPHVNLVPSALPGDLYKYVSESVWKKVTEDVISVVDNKEQLDDIIDTLIDIKTQMSLAEANSEKYKSLIQAILYYKSIKGDLVKAAAPIYWNRVTDSKQRRKVVKR